MGIGTVSPFPTDTAYTVATVSNVFTSVPSLVFTYVTCCVPHPSFNATSFPASCGFSGLFSGNFVSPSPTTTSLFPVIIPYSDIVNSNPSTITFKSYETVSTGSFIPSILFKFSFK